MSYFSDRELKAGLSMLFPSELAHNDSMKSIQIQPASVDLRLSSTIMEYRMNVVEENRILDPRKADVSEYMRSVEIVPGECYILKPGHQHFILGSTMEAIHIPDHCIGRVEGRSSLGRLGLRIHSTAGFLDPGFTGVITLEISLDGRYPVKLWPGDRVCQVTVAKMESPAQRPYGHPSRGSKYQNATTVEPSKIAKDSR